MKLNIQNTFSQELPADPNNENSRRQVFEACFSHVTPRIPSNPSLVHASSEMLQNIGLEANTKDSDAFLSIFSGAKTMEETEAYAMCYGGHQFGSWAGQLGDGRAINLGEVVHNDQRWALQLKGAGETPYSRTADGLAVLRSSVREHLCSEAMHHLGVPTTRSLSLMLTGDSVMRDMLYNGNAAYEKGAVVCRVAPSFIRFGNFEIFASRSDHKTLKQLADYTIRHFFPQIKEKEGSKERYIKFFRAVAEQTLEMIIHWQRVGFVHGVMNTDNLSILGLSIDYGPYGWLEGYDHDWTPNTTDNNHKRYRYGQQPGVALWNLTQLGNALYPLVEEVAPLEAVLEDYKVSFASQYQDMMRAKLGLAQVEKQDAVLISDLENLLQLVETDMTIFFRKLSQIGKDYNLRDNPDFLSPLIDAFYQKDALNESVSNAWREWLDRYVKRLGLESVPDEARQASMNQVNPKYVLRNYMAQLAIDKANEGDFSLVEELYELLRSPYDENPQFENWFAKRPEWARHKVGCSMLSCSS